ERTLAAGVEPSAILALGMDVQQVSALLLEPVDGAHRVVGRHALPIRVSDGETFPPLERLAQVCRQLGRRLGRPLWLPSGEGPAMSDADPALGLALAHVVAVADPLPPLRVLVAGLSTGESLAAAQEALASAPCDVVALCRPGAYDDVAGLRDDIANAAPDAIVVCGGYDVPGGAARGPALALSELVAQAVRLLRVERPPLMVFAGNRWAAADVLEMWREIPGAEVHAVLNVLPARGMVHTSSLAVILSQHYWSLCRAQPEMQQVAHWVTPPAAVRSFQWSFAQATRLWRETHRLADLHALYCGPRQWLHVWSVADDLAVRVRMTPPGVRPRALDRWPPLRLVSGPWPQAWPRPKQHWHEPLGILPIAAAAGQVEVAISDWGVEMVG
ncbi:MAG: glutamate mutase L, partial [Caldilineaceae bacterium]|nr:glutamate mutase L [Caldilineaceae bacterium]